MIRTDHPQSTIRFKCATAFAEPGFGENIIFSKAGELVPIIIHRINLAFIRAVQIATQLQIIGWVSKDEINRTRGDFFELFEAITQQNLIMEGTHI